MNRRPVPNSRIRRLNSREFRPEGRFLLYWMTSYRRLSSNFALQRAVEVARELRRPLVILEALRAGYPWASDRLHRFVIDGMAGHARALRGTPATYVPYVEPSPGAGCGLLRSLAAEAAGIITDDYPCFFIPRMSAAAAGQVSCRLEAIDSSGVLPVRESGREFVTALSFRAHLQRTLREHLSAWPEHLDLTDLPGPAPPIAASLGDRWVPTPFASLQSPDQLIASLPIDHTVRPASIRGGSEAARAALRRFTTERLASYATGHSHPDARATSELSPWLHFGHLSSHDVFEAVMSAERWTTRRLSPAGGGRRGGWWGASESAEAFLDQLITWRELGLNFCVSRPDDYWKYDSVPAWARSTLETHAEDPRTPVYDQSTLDRAETHDEVWNAAQRQLRNTGWMHNYLRMLWGKKILEWTRSPSEALATMTDLMNKYALDGRDPNSYAGYAWTLGRYDRPWGPERPIFGTVRYMSSTNAVRKLRMKNYLLEFGRRLT